MSFLLGSRDLEGSIAYLQEEHAKTLRALHEEIRKLQQKCSRLTFELTMSGSQCNRKAECDAAYLEKELAEVRSDVVSLCSQLSMQGEAMDMMQQQMKWLSKELSSAKQSKKDIIRICNCELEQKAKVIAQLTAQLHKASRKMHPVDYPPEQISPPSTSTHLPRTEHPQASRISWQDGRPFSAHTRQLVKRSVVDSSQASYLLSSPPAITSITPSPPFPLHTPLPSSTPSIRRASRARCHRLVRSLEHPSSASLTTSSSSITATDLPSANRRQLSQPGPSWETTPKLPQMLAIVKPVLPPIGYVTAGGDPGDQNHKIPTKFSDAHPIMESTVDPGAPLAPVMGMAGRHRRFVLAKSQGLSSAPCGSLRLLNYPRPPQAGNIGQETHTQGDEGVEQSEGTLLVKQKVAGRDGSSNSVLQH